MSDATLTTVRACLQATMKLDAAQAAAIDLHSTPVQVPQWTSMAHLELILAVENQFGVMFEAEEIAELASVSAIITAVERRKVS